MNFPLEFATIEECFEHFEVEAELAAEKGKKKIMDDMKSKIVMPGLGNLPTQNPPRFRGNNKKRRKR
jgi:hypothetical protein